MRVWLGALAMVPLVLLGLLATDPLGLVQSLWPVIPIAFLAAAFANATAIGGGFVFVPVFVLGYGLGPLTALKLSLGTQAFGMSSGALGWSRACLEPRTLLRACLWATPGMIVGTFTWTPDPLDVKATFGWVSLAIGVVMALEYRFGEGRTGTEPAVESVASRMTFGLACLAGGLITAWVSLGIGEVVALWLLFRHRMRIEIAIGTGVAALAICSILGFGLHLWLERAHGVAFPWDYLAFTVPGVLLGGASGARAGRWLEERLRARGRRSPLKAIFAVVVLLDGVVMLLHVMRHGV